MCGINGIYSLNPVSKLNERLKKMNASIKHRGPDADDIELINNAIGFGHRRLAIIDLDIRSKQPMTSNSGKTIITFNGEIFNFLELKEELKNNYEFKTQSDTEVLLAGYELKGIEWLLSNINGMFAFCIYDKNTEYVYLVRDRFSIKPLFYTIYDGTLIFSSEIKGILNSGLVDAKMNYAAIDDYLGHRYVREPFTFFENIYQLKSATYIKYKPGNVLEYKKYWELPSLNFDSNYNEIELVNKAKTEVEKAVKRWLIADVKVGTYLSGGVDSSLTTAIIAKNREDKIDTYTIGFENEKYNEFHYARIVSEKYKTQHREISLKKDQYFKEWERLIGFKDAPLAVPNEIPLAIMTTALSQDITVVISGEGADELFGGYGRIFRSSLDYENHATGEISFQKYFQNKYEYVSREIRDKYLNVKENYREHFDEEIKTDFSSNRNEENIFRFFYTYHIQGLLNRVDMTTMQASVEARPPFLDHELIEFVFKNIPYDLKLKWKSEENKEKAKKMYAEEYSEALDTPKYILKKIAESYLPNEVIYRKKMGFPVPLTEWFPSLIETAKKELFNAEWIKKDMIDELCNELKTHKSDRAGQLLWMFLNIELFYKIYFNKNYKY